MFSVAWGAILGDLEEHHCNARSHASMNIDWDIPLDTRTTFGVGGKASHFCAVSDEEQLALALAHSRIQGLETLVLGGGSNMLVADTGFYGLTVEYTDTRTSFQRHGDEVLFRVGGGAVWDDVVALAVRENWAGIECLSGIPGRVGAAPVQNIGAYGQEIRQVVQSVRAVDRDTGDVTVFPVEDCGFRYRYSHFKGVYRGRFVITEVALRLRPGGAPTLTYPELRERLRVTGEEDAPSLEEVRQTVLALRREKSMIYDPADPNHRSAGSFFVNPIVSLEHTDRIREKHAADSADDKMPVYEVTQQSCKLSAAWLVERSGFRRGTRHGPVGLSTAHALAIINRGGAKASQIVDFAAAIRQTVRATFDLTLQPEPVFVGFGAPADEILG